MTYKELWEKSRSELNLDQKTIKYMFKYYLNLDESDRIKDKLIGEDKYKSYILKVEELKAGVPIQYVVGNVDFLDITLI
jgi:hypothetical protein